MSEYLESACEACDLHFISKCSVDLVSLICQINDPSLSRCSGHLERQQPLTRCRRESDMCKNS